MELGTTGQLPQDPYLLVGCNDDGEREARLSKQGWRMHIQRKGTKDKPISETQQRRNHRITKTRARMEHVFAGLA